MHILIPIFDIFTTYTSLCLFVLDFLTKQSIHFYCSKSIKFCANHTFVYYSMLKKQSYTLYTYIKFNIISEFVQR